MRSGQLFRAHNAASAAPLGTIEFALDFRKIGTSCRVDVVIDPYAEPKNFRNPVGADAASALKKFQIRRALP